MSKKKEEIVISDRLLSWVFGCECEVEIVCIDLKCGKIEIESVFFLMLVESNRIKVMPRKINLDTFVRLGKIKAFECGYEIIEKSKETYVKKGYKTLGGHNLLSFIKYILKWGFNNKPFNTQSILQALEWVAEKVGGDNV